MVSSCRLGGRASFNVKDSELPGALTSVQHCLIQVRPFTAVDKTTLMTTGRVLAKGTSKNHNDGSWREGSGFRLPNSVCFTSCVASSSSLYSCGISSALIRAILLGWKKQTKLLNSRHMRWPAPNVKQTVRELMNTDQHRL